MSILARNAACCRAIRLFLPRANYTFETWLSLTRALPFLGLKVFPVVTQMPYLIQSERENKRGKNSWLMKIDAWTQTILPKLNLYNSSERINRRLGEKRCVFSQCSFYSFVILGTTEVFSKRHLSPSIFHSDHPSRSVVIFLAIRGETI